MTLMEKLQRACAEGADLWITGMEKDGLNPFGHLIALEGALKGIGKAIQSVEDAKMVGVPGSMFAELVMLATIGKHVVVVRLVETGKLSADEIVMEKTGTIGEL